MQGGQWKICRVKPAVASSVIVLLGYMSDFSDSSFSFVNTCLHYSQYQTTFPWQFVFHSVFLYSVCLHLCMLVFNMHIHLTYKYLRSNVLIL